MFKALKAVWIYRIFTCNTTLYTWTQLANHFIGKFANISTVIKFSLDSRTIFPAIENMHPFYKEVLLSYGYARGASYEIFCNNILNQPLWGNCFVSVNHKKKKSTLLLRNWIRSGENNIGDLKFINGEVDEDHIYSIVQYQTNIHAEILLVKKALAPYKRLLVGLTNVNELVNPSVMMKKSTDAYFRLVNIKCSSIIIDKTYVSYCV